MQHKKNKEAAVVVFSGGQDSTTCLLYAKKHYKKVYAVSFDYHQRHVAELDAAKEICEKLDVEQTIMDMTLLNQLAPNSLTRDDMKVDSTGRGYTKYICRWKKYAVFDICSGIRKAEGCHGYPDGCISE